MTRYSDMTPDELREYNRVKQANRRAKIRQELIAAGVEVKYAPKRKFATDEERKAVKRERYLQKTDDVTTRRNKKHQSRDDYLAVANERRREYLKTRYATDEKFREYVKARSREAYQKQKHQKETA